MTHYPNTFIAIKELLTNSLQANAKNIRIRFIKGDSKNPFDAVIYSIVVEDDGHGLPYSEFDKSFMNIGTHNKENGLGIGRFAAFQLGKVMRIESAAYDSTMGKYTSLKVEVDSRLLSSALEETSVNVDLTISDKPLPSFYRVTILDLYENDQTCLRKNKLGAFFQDVNFKQRVFESYAYEIFENKVSFYLNDECINRNDYIKDTPIVKDVDYVDIHGLKHSIQYMFYNVLIPQNEISVFVQMEQDNVRISLRRYGYASKWYTANLGAWYIYICSNIITPDMAIGFDFSTLGDKEANNLMSNIKMTIDDFFKVRNKDYELFVEKLVGDASYPFKTVGESNLSLQESVFRKTAYLLESNAKILEKNEDVRRMLYPMLNKLIQDGETRFIVENVISLPEDRKSELYDLLQKTDLEDVIRFSSEVAKKNKFLDFLYNLTYGELSKSLKERSQLHKIVQNELWIFNEGYSGTPFLWSDKNLANNLTDLHTKHFGYELSSEDENLIADYKETVADITDLFFYNKKLLTDGRSEVMIVELKAPSCAISDKEINQARRYAYDIQTMPVFPKANVAYKIYLVSSKMSNRARSEVNSRNKDNSEHNMIEYKHENGEDIRVYVYEWAELIERNRRALDYLSNSLQVKQEAASELFHREYPDLVIDKAKARLMPKALSSVK